MSGRDCHRAGAVPLTRRAFLTAASATLASAWGGKGPSRTALPGEVLDFHRESLVFDLHIDTIQWQRFPAYEVARRHASALRSAAPAWQMEPVRAGEAGLGAAMLGVVVAPREERPQPLEPQSRPEPQSSLAQTLATLDLLERFSRYQPQRLVFARTGAELRRAVADRGFAALAGLKGAHGIEDRIENLRTAFEGGLRMIGLVHLQASAAAYPTTMPAFGDRGLTPFGFDLIAEMESLGMVVDLAWLNARGFDDALVAMTRPCVVSHGACRPVHDTPQNLGDAQLRRLADRGGVLGLALGRDLLGPGGLDAFLAHAEHATRVAGAEAVAIGSGWDLTTRLLGPAAVRGLPFLTEALLARGWRSDRVRKLLGENALRAVTDALG